MTMGIIIVVNITYFTVNYSKKITIKFDEMNVPKKFAQHTARKQYRLTRVQDCSEILNPCIKSKILYWTIHHREITKKEKIMM